MKHSPDGLPRVLPSLTEYSDSDPLTCSEMKGIKTGYIKIDEFMYLFFCFHKKEIRELTAGHIETEYVPEKLTISWGYR
jgi:hypothetical protein